ncbi:hypothetical protein FRB99_002951 [Tulasnella sp. 403]|nr:hypothetical protein FRB99_002951 [Tulasnella sp. 403]
MLHILTSALALIAVTAVAFPMRRQAPNNIVKITSATDYCMIMPSTPHTNIGDSEHPGGMQAFCSNPTDPTQGTLPPNFWSNVAFVTGTGASGKAYAQLTGCINPTLIDRLNANDGGGQYDSNGGDGGQGNPQGSKCVGYASYVELVEPAANRACIKCCNDPGDCPVSMDTSGCQTVIPGNYFSCTS